MEGALLGLFMVSATLFTALLEHPGSPARAALPQPLIRRALMGLAMGATAVALIYSPWGKRSGAHFNPAVTLAFLRLGKIAPWDATFYVASQFAGGLLGVLLVAAGLRRVLEHPAVNYAVTVPGASGEGIAFLAEALISFVLMLTLLFVSNTRRLARLTGICAGLLVAAYITLEAPLSGMSMNPARTVASAFPAGALGGLWIYFTAPTLGMLLAARAYTGLRGARAVACAKLHHDNPARCIFRCGW
jgi:aquaporin Z